MGYLCVEWFLSRNAIKVWLLNKTKMIIFSSEGEKCFCEIS